MSAESDGRLAQIREAAQRIMVVADGGLGIASMPLEDLEDEAQEAEAALQECLDLAVQIRDLATGGPDA